MPSLEDEVSLSRLGYSLAFLGGSYMSCAIIMFLYLMKFVGNTKRERTLLEDVFCVIVLVFTVARTLGMPLRVFSKNYSRFVNIMQDMPIFLYAICYCLVLYFWSKRMNAVLRPPLPPDPQEDEELLQEHDESDEDDEGFFSSADLMESDSTWKSSMSSLGSNSAEIPNNISLEVTGPPQTNGHSNGLEEQKPEAVVKVTTPTDAISRTASRYKVASGNSDGRQSSRYNSKYGSRFNSKYKKEDSASETESIMDEESLIVPKSTKRSNWPKEKMIMFAALITGICSCVIWIGIDTEAYIAVKNPEQDLTLKFSETTSLINLSILFTIHITTFIYFNRKVDPQRRSIEIHLQEMRKILRSWAVTIAIRAIVSGTIVYYDWLATYDDWVWLIYPPLYFCQEIFAVVYLEFKLLQPYSNFVLDVDAIKVETFFDPRTENPQVFICKREDNVLAVKSSASINEITIMQKVRGKHPQIINYVDHEEVTSREGTKKMFLFMEAMPNIPLEPPTLYNYIRNSYVQTKNGLKNRLSFAHLLHVALKVAKGIAFLHENNIVHLDIKSDNVLVMPHVMENRKVKLIVKIIDFGLAEIVKPGTSLVKSRKDRHHHIWVHPDMFDKSACDGKKADVYSFGYLLCVIFGNREFNLKLHSGHLREPIPKNAFENILNTTLLELLRSRFLQMDPTIKRDMVFLYQMCTEDCRPIEEVCEKIQSIVAQVNEALNTDLTSRERRNMQFFRRDENTKRDED